MGLTVPAVRVPNKAGRASPSSSSRHPAIVHKPCVTARSSSTTDMAAPSKYAILRLGGVRQMLQEGLLYTCPKSCLLQQQQVVEHFSTSPAAAGNGTGAAVPTTTGSQRSYVLSNVLGLHNGQEFTWGSPYLPNTQVEVEVVEEFQGPTARSSMAAAAAASIASTSDSSLMTIYRVKHIRAAV